MRSLSMLCHQMGPHQLLLPPQTPHTPLRPTSSSACRSSTASKPTHLCTSQNAISTPSSGEAASSSAPAASATLYIPSQKTHSLHARGYEVIQGLGEWAEHRLSRFLKPSHSCWQPQDLLPEPSSPDFFDQARASLEMGMPPRLMHPFFTAAMHNSFWLRLGPCIALLWRVDSPYKASACSCGLIFARLDLSFLRTSKPPNRCHTSTKCSFARMITLPQVLELRRGAQQLPNDYLVVLVGDMVTEEALPSYMNMLNTLDCTKVS